MSVHGSAFIFHARRRKDFTCVPWFIRQPTRIMLVVEVQKLYETSEYASLKAHTTHVQHNPTVLMGLFLKREIQKKVLTVQLCRGGPRTHIRGNDDSLMSVNILASTISSSTSVRVIVSTCDMAMPPYVVLHRYPPCLTTCDAPVPAHISYFYRCRIIPFALCNGELIAMYLCRTIYFAFWTGSTLDFLAGG